MKEVLLLNLKQNCGIYSNLEYIWLAFYIEKVAFCHTIVYFIITGLFLLATLDCSC